MNNWKKRSLVILIAILYSVAARLLGDALHIPGFYDGLGIFLAASLLPLKWAIIAFIAIPLVLTSYYAVYLIAIWIYVLIGIIYWVIKRKVMSKVGILAYILVPVVYALSWLILYSYYTHTFKYFGLYLRMKGFYVLLFDAVVSICLAEILSRTIVSHKTIDLDLKRLDTIIVLGIVIIGISFYLVQVNEWSITSGFHEVNGYLKFHHKMDFVWLPLGEKGINNYYYPETRFTRGSKGYQVWIGMYWVQGYHDIADVGLVSQFAIWDQNFWLGSHGSTDPYTYVDLVENISKIDYKGYNAYLMYGGMISRSDVEPYEEVVLRGFFITYYDAKRDRTAIIYACATEENINEMMDELKSIVYAWNPR